MLTYADICGWLTARARCCCSIKSKRATSGAPARYIIYYIHGIMYTYIKRKDNLYIWIMYVCMYVYMYMYMYVYIHIYIYIYIYILYDVYDVIIYDIYYPGRQRTKRLRTG
jgi:hypothetical protein